MQDPSSPECPRATGYLMESEEEAIRLDVKTDRNAVRRQALWCGVEPGLRVLDAGCGAGVTTSILAEQVLPGGSVLGVDYSPQRIDYAVAHYGGEQGVAFALHDLRDPLSRFGSFDLIWMRFVLEYHRSAARTIVKNLLECLKPGGRLCLLDLDYNCLIHHELPPATMDALQNIMNAVDERFDFDTFVGRKLYAFLYDAGLEDIRVELAAHNLFYGPMKESDKFNLMKKIEIAGSAVNDVIEACYPGGYARFYEDFVRHLDNPRRFTYTPLLMTSGRKPSSG